MLVKTHQKFRDYFAGFIQIYPDGSAQRTMNNNENYDKLNLLQNLVSDKKQMTLVK